MWRLETYQRYITKVRRLSINNPNIKIPRLSSFDFWSLTKEDKSWYNDYDMNKLIPFAKYSKKAKKNSFLSNASVVVDRKGVPLGFVFGRDSFISFLEHIDSEFEKKVDDPKKAFDNPAGKLIDLIEERLPINPKFIKDLKSSIAETKKNNWIPFEKVAQLLHV